MRIAWFILVAMTFIRRHPWWTLLLAALALFLLGFLIFGVGEQVQGGAG